MAAALIDADTKLKVSSVLNRDTKNYGRQFLCDGREETCWNSDQGEVQWIVMNFAKPVKITKLEFKFQGGFCCLQTFLERYNPSKSSERPFEQVSEFFPKDVNSTQIFELPESNYEPSDCFRIRFEKLTDMFGRLIIYNFQVYGHIQE